MRQVVDLFAVPPTRANAADNGTTIVAFRTGMDLDALLSALRRLTEEP
jgi:hypothetical protein